MCGHGTIGVVTAALEHQLIQPKRQGKLLLDVPAGQVEVHYQQDSASSKVTAVKIFNVASYLAHQNVVVDVPELGALTVDVAYGGNFYVIVEPQANFPGIEHWSASDIIKWSPIVRDIVGKAVTCIHPQDPTVQGVSHLLWTGSPTGNRSNGANAVFYGDKAIDRSPCGTGTSARMAQLFGKGVLNLGDTFVHESYIGSQFVGKIEAIEIINTKQGVIKAIKPSIQGWAHVYGHNTITIDDEDPYAYGFTVV